MCRASTVLNPSPGAGEQRQGGLQGCSAETSSERLREYCGSAMGGHNPTGGLAAQLPQAQGDALEFVRFSLIFNLGDPVVPGSRGVFGVLPGMARPSL